MFGGKNKADHSLWIFNLDDLNIQDLVEAAAEVGFDVWQEGDSNTVIPHLTEQQSKSLQSGLHEKGFSSGIKKGQWD